MKSKRKVGRVFSLVLTVILAVSMCVTDFTASALGLTSITLLSDQDIELHRDYRDILCEISPSYSSLTHNSAFASGYVKMQGIDVSKWQGTIDWDKVAADGVDYVIIKIAGRGYSDGTITLDPMFTTNIEGAKAAGLKVGVYFFTQAISKAEAIEEANFVISNLGDYSLDLPVYYDIESIDYATGRLDSANLSYQQKTALCEAFCSTIVAAGYSAGIYANKYWLTSMIDGESLAENYEIWLANWTTETSYTGTYTTWQYGDSGSVNGISGAVDTDIRYSLRTAYAKSSVTLTTIGATSKPTVVGDGTLTFTSSDTSVAKVNSKGKITAVGVGTCRITATSSINGTKATITVNVTAVSGTTDILGDANCDGELDASDASLILLYASWFGVSQSSVNYYSFMDYDGDGEISAIDAALLLAYLAKNGVSTG